MSLTLYSITLFIIFSIALCQQNDIQLSIKVEGTDYSFKFNPTITEPSELAKKFCYENGGRFGITLETVDNCIAPIAQRLQAEVNAVSTKTAEAQAEAQQLAQAAPTGSAEMKPLQVKFNVGGTDYQLQFQPTAVSTEAVATQFCQQKGGEFGITEDTLPDCVRGVNKHLVGEVQAQQQALRNQQIAALAAEKAELDRLRSVTVDLTIENQEFHLQFQPAITPPLSVATRLCREQGATFGVTAATLNQCISSITGYLQKEVDK